MLREITAKTMLHYHERTFSTNWDANIYRGCEHGCVYCFAQYSHKYLEADFFGDVFVKTNAAEVLNKEFAKKKWEKIPVCIAGVSDAYQPAEIERQIMPEVLEVFIKHKNPLAFATKSTLLLRDIEYFERLAKVTDVSIAVSVCTLNENYRKLIEPNAAPTLERLQMLKQLKEIGCHTGILLMPIIPFISDNDDNLNEIFKIAKELEVDFMHAWTLHLRGNTKQHFFSFLSQHFPELLPMYKTLYPYSGLNSEYRQEILDKIKKLRQEYQLFNNYRLPLKTKKEEQLRLFE